ncbi:MAG: 50S ribosomal protein L9 [Parcubacteria group bacterium GW2011_GWA2_31_28]|nr:MAG: 50S ribosomal protein L9 [Parcubacteria group bacterium GW2011_GWA2_31_28]
MKIILTKDVPNLGQKGKVAEVKFGFGKNWLIPQGLAILATPSVLKQIEYKQSKLKEALEEKLKQFSGTIEKIKKTVLVIIAKVTEKDNLYSHITAKNIKDELKKQHKIEINEKQIKILDEIKHTGEYKVILELASDLTQELSVKIDKELNKKEDKKKKTINQKTVKKTA